MPLESVLSVQIKPDRVQQYQETVAELATRAREQSDPFKWTAHEVAYGGEARLHFSSSIENFAELGQRGIPPEMVLRVFGEERGAQAMATFGECSQVNSSSVSTDRPDLSYPPDEGSVTMPAAVVTSISARSGQIDACEEVIRKIAEAIPKVGDPARMNTFQTILGDLSHYWTVRPISDLSELDQQLPPAELLNQAFGPAEGGLIYRTGLDAIETAERRILLYRADLSNPG
jgi:hypothetical protein